MSSTTAFADTIRNQTLDLIKQSQQATVDAVEAWAGLIADGSPQSVDYTSYFENLPDPVDTTEQIFDFSEQLLATHRAFFTSLVSAVAPVAEATRRTAQEAAEAGVKTAKSATKA